MLEAPSSRRHLTRLALAMLLVAPCRGLDAQEASAARSSLTLASAVEEAFARSPSLRARKAAVEEARAQLRAAVTYPYNPALEATLGRRRGPGGSVTDRGVEVSQEIELGGQRGKRRSAGRADLAAAEARYLHDRRLLAARVESAFAEAVRARGLAGVEATDSELARTFKEYARKRLEAGAGTQVETNLAGAAYARALRRLRGAEAAYQEARLLLGEAVGRTPGDRPEPAGDFPAADGEPPALSVLLATALENRADLRALRLATDAARARISLASAGAWPNARLAASYGKEEGTDRIVGGGIAIGLPLFNRNQGDLALRRAEMERVHAEAEAGRLGAEREVAAAYYSFLAARSAAESLREQVLGTLEESLELLRLSFEAGKIGGVELLVFRREFVDSEREYVEAQALAWQARIALDLAAGRLLTPVDAGSRAGASSPRREQPPRVSRESPDAGKP